VFSKLPGKSSFFAQSSAFKADIPEAGKAPSLLPGALVMRTVKDVGGCRQINYQTVLSSLGKKPTISVKRVGFSFTNTCICIKRKTKPLLGALTSRTLPFELLRTAS
jgi:hypothetical protein